MKSKSENLKKTNKYKVFSSRKGYIIFCAFGFLVVTSLVGSVSSTLAWYQYATHAGMQFKGRVVGDNDNMEIGLFAESMPNYEQHNFEKDPNIKDLYWHKGDLTEDVLKYYGSNNGYIENDLAPVTSGSYLTNGKFNLLMAPSKVYPTPIENASKRDYLYLNLAFRARMPEAGSVEYDPNLKISIKNAYSQSSGQIYNSTRIHFDFGPKNNFILNPNVNEKGQTTVAGPLDLNNDGYYDFDYETRKEICYGSFGSVTYNDTPSGDEGPLVDDQSSFTAHHKEGVAWIDKSKSNFYTSEYLAPEDVLLGKSYSYSSLSEEYKYIKTCGVTIYLEGWDEHCIDTELFNNLYVGLEFAVKN